MSQFLFRLTLMLSGFGILMQLALFRVVRDATADDSLLIVSSNFQDYDQALYLMDINGTPLRRLTRVPGNESVVATSPNGEWLIVMSHTTLWHYSVHIPTGKAYDLAPAGSLFRAWSPDGGWAVFEQGSTYWVPHAIFRVRPNGTNRQFLTDVAYDSRFGGWTADGAWMIFESQRNAHTNLYRMRPDGRDEEQLTSIPDKDRFVGFSPQGDWLIFKNYRAGFQDLYRMRVDGSDQQLLLPGLYEISIVGWSPDQQQVLILSGRVNLNTYYVANADGTHAQPVPVAPSAIFLGWTAESDGLLFRYNEGYPSAFRVAWIERDLVTQTTLFETQSTAQIYVSLSARYDGENIWYRVEYPESFSYYRMRSDGTDQQLIASDVPRHYQYYQAITPTPLSNGGWLMIENMDSPRRLHRVNVDTLADVVIHSAAGDNNNWPMFHGWLSLSVPDWNGWGTGLAGLGLIVWGMGMPLLWRRLRRQESVT